MPKTSAKSPTKSFRRKFTTPGAFPGTHARHESAQTAGSVVLSMEYRADDLVETVHEGLDKFAHSGDKKWSQWVDFHGVGDGRELESLSAKLGFHHLAVADALNVGQRPKIEAYDDFHFLVLRAVTLDEDKRLKWSQVSMFLRDNLLLTVHEEELTGFEALRERIRQGRQTIRSSGVNYLSVMLLDSVVDGYFPILEHYGDYLDDCEDRVLAGHDAEVLSEVYEIRRDLALFRRSVWPLREVLNILSRDEDSPTGRQHQLHLRDIYDHVLQTLEFLESYRELASSLVDAHLNLVGQKTNEVMKVLTIVSTIFIPLTFIAGIYGMNFDTSQPWNMPELRWQYGYVAFWILILLLVVGLVGLFRHLGWVGRKKS